MASQVALMVKYPPANAGDTRNAGSVPGLGRSPGRGNSNPLQSSCLENVKARGVWQTTVYGVTKSLTHFHTKMWNSYMLEFYNINETSGQMIRW